MAAKTYLKTTLAISVFFVFLAVAGSVHAKIIYVNDDAVGANDGSSWTDAYKYIQDALAAAAIGDEIHVAQGIYKPDRGNGITPGSRKATFQLINDVTIKGGYEGTGGSDPNARDIKIYETTLSGDLNGNDRDVNDPYDMLDDPTRAENSHHVVTGSGTEVTAVLDGFTITGGYAYDMWPGHEEYGGGMYNELGNPTVLNCTFQANTARFGGGMRNDRSSPVLNNCSFNENFGGWCGGMSNLRSTLTLTNCTFTGNRQCGMENHTSNTTLINCAFVGNMRGVYNNTSNLTLSNCSFINNFIRGMQGFDGNITLTNCDFIGNKEGGMDSLRIKLTLRDCTFIGNSGSEGGGSRSLGCSTTLYNCLFIGNSARYGGGGLFVRKLNGGGGGDVAGYWNMSLANCTFVGNSAPYGNALAADSFQHSYPARTRVNNCIFWDGGNEIGRRDASTFQVTYSANTGLPGEGNINADPCFVQPGYRDANGIWIEGDYHLLPGSPCIDAGNTDYMADPNGTDFDGRPRVIAGRIDMGVYEFQSNLVLYVDADATGANDGSSWADAFNFLQDALATAYYGDEIRIAQGIYKPDQGADITPGDREETFQLINGVTLKGGYAGAGEPNPNDRHIELYKTILTGDLNGDDIDVADPCDLLTEPTRSENSYNVVTGSGTDETAILDGFTITGGNAGGSYPNNCGGGMYNYRGSPTVANCMLRSNAARSDGGGVCNYGSYKATPRLTNCTFKRNSSRRCGGGMCNWDGEATLTNCTFIGNSTADDGGGIYISNDSKLALTYCTFRGNLAGRSGGGIVGGDSTLNNCTFDWNLAGRFGGGIYVIGRPTLTDCTFSGNSAGFGGGVASYFGPTLTNCRITGNAAVYYGGGLASFGYGSPRLTNCTFAGNSAPNGTALACDSLPGEPQSQLVLTNSILWDGGDEIWNNDGSTIIITYSDVQGGWLGEGNIDDAPLFVELGYWEANGTPYDANDDFWVEGDYHLLTDSPCIDTGDPNYIAGPNETDLDGRPRIIGGRIDMGAYEAPVFAETRIAPQTINLASKGNWITCYIRLPDEYDVADIEPNSVFLEGEIKPEQFSVDEQQQVATARFTREDVQPILEVGDINLKITGRLTDGTVFEAADTIKLINKAGKN